VVCSFIVSHVLEDVQGVFQIAAHSFDGRETHVPRRDVPDVQSLSLFPDDSSELTLGDSHLCFLWLSGSTSDSLGCVSDSRKRLSFMCKYRPGGKSVPGNFCGGGPAGISKVPRNFCVDVKGQSSKVPRNFFVRGFGPKCPLMYTEFAPQRPPFWPPFWPLSRPPSTGPSVAPSAAPHRKGPHRRGRIISYASEQDRQEDRSQWSCRSN